MTPSHRYRIHTVAELTGVPTSNLRAWERRYGVPAPERTESSYRLYSDADIMVIRRMRELIDQGLSPSEAAPLARETKNAPVAPADPFTVVVDRLAELTRRMEAVELERAARAALVLGDSYTVVDSVFVPALRKIGDEWHAGKISSAHEHLASEILGSIVRELLRHVQPVHARARAILACFRDELHTLPLYAAAFGFAERGVITHLLGARTDPEALRVAVRQLEPQIVGLSVTLPPTDAVIGNLLDGYAEAAGSVPWLVGGSGVLAIADEVTERGGLVVEPKADALRLTIEAVLSRPKRS